MAITLSHLAVKVTSKKNSSASVIKDSRFFFQTPSFLSNNLAHNTELITTYRDDFYYADLSYLPITLADFTTNSVAAKVSYKSYTSASGTSGFDLYTNIPGWQNTHIVIPAGSTFTITAQKWCAVNFIGTPNGNKAYPEGVYTAGPSVTRPPDDGVLDRSEVDADTIQVIPTGPNGWPAPDKRPFSVVGTLTQSPWVGPSQVTDTPTDGVGGVGVGGPLIGMGIEETEGPAMLGGVGVVGTGGTGGGGTGTYVPSFQVNRSYSGTNTTASPANLYLAFNDDALTTPWNYNDNYGFFIINVTVGSAGGDTVDTDVIEGTLFYYDNDTYKNFKLTVNTVTQEDVTVNWNNLNNAKLLDGSPSSTDSFGNSETKLLKATWNLVTLEDLTGNPGTDPGISSTKFTNLDYLPRWLEGYYTNTKINDFYTGCLTDTKYMSQYLTNNSFNPSFFKNKNNNYRKFYTTAFYTDIKTISIFAPSLTQPGPIFHLNDSAKGVYSVNKPYYIKTQGNYLEFYNLHFVRFQCTCTNNEIDLTSQLKAHPPLFDTSFYIMNALGDFIVIPFEDLNQSTSKIPFSITGDFWVIYESKTLLNSLIDKTAQVLINGYPSSVAYKMNNPFYKELSARFDYHSKYFIGDYDYQKHFQCFAFSNNWKSALASDLNLTSPIVWNTSTSFNLLSNNFVETDLDERKYEFVSENLSRVGNDFYATNSLPSLIEVYYAGTFLTSNEYTVSGNKITLVNTQKPYNNILVRYRKNKISTTYSGNKVSTVAYTGDSKTVYGIGLAKITVANKSKKYQKTSWTLNPTTFNSEFK